MGLNFSTIRGGRVRSGTVSMPNGVAHSNTTGADAADASGWPGEDRGSRLRWKRGPPHSAARAEEFRAQARPQPSFTARLPDLPGAGEADALVNSRNERVPNPHQARQSRLERQYVTEFEPAYVFGTKPATMGIMDVDNGQGRIRGLTIIGISGIIPKEQVCVRR